MFVTCAELCSGSPPPFIVLLIFNLALWLELPCTAVYILAGVMAFCKFLIVVP